MKRLLRHIFGFFAILVLSASTVQAQEGAQVRPGTVSDFTRSYDTFGVPSLGAPPELQEQQEIVDINLGFDAGSVLGCSGLDIGEVIQGTFEVGNLADEFTNYLKTALAKQALTLVYSSPAVSAVLDGLKAVGHARASILQEKCDANEIMANVRNQRLRGEAQEDCLKSEEFGIVDCEDPEVLAGYIDGIAQTKRWTGTLHEFICPEADCEWLGLVPNFAFDLGTGEGKTADPAISPTGMFDFAANEGRILLDEREAMARELIGEEGLEETLRIYGDMATELEPEGGASSGGGSSSGGGTASGLDDSFFGDNACVDEGTGARMDDMLSVINNQEGFDFGGVPEMISGLTKCLLGRHVHPQVDVRIASLPRESADGMKQSLAQAAAAQASINVFNALIFKLSETLARSGSEEGAGAETMNPEIRDFAMMQIDNLKTMRDSMRDTLNSHEDLAQRVIAMNDNLERSQKEERKRLGSSIGSAGQGRATAADYSQLFK